MGQTNLLIEELPDILRKWCLKEVLKNSLETFWVFGT